MNKLHTIPHILVNIKTNYLQNHRYAFCNNIKMNKKLLLILYKEGLILGYKEESKLLKIKLKYFRDNPLISDIKAIYKVSLKESSNFKKTSSYHKKYDIFFLSTDNGIISSNQLIKLQSLSKKSGGQVLIGIDLINKFY